MLDLIQTNPEKAIALAVPYAWRKSLPANVTRYLESWVDGRGSLTVAAADGAGPSVYRYAHLGGKRYQVFVYGKRVREVSQEHVPLHGIALDEKMALLADSLRALPADEANALESDRGKAAPHVCPVCGRESNFQNQEAAADIGGEVAWFCGSEHLRLANQSLAASGGNGAAPNLSSASNDAWTHGPKTVLYMRLNFPDDLTEPISEADANSVMLGVNAFYAKNSYDEASLTTTVTPLLTLPETKGWYGTAGPGALLDDARALARTAGYETANYDRDIATFTPIPEFAFGGLAAVHGKGVWLQSPGVTVTAHELGHNYGLVHANLWDTSTNNSIIGLGTNIEYGNIFDTMGSGSSDFGAMFKNILDWIPDTAVHAVTNSGVFRIYPFDGPTRVNGRRYAVKVRKDFQRDYWLEFRGQFPANPSLQNGVLLNWSPWAETGGSDLLDTTPGTPGGLADAAVVVGRTYSDIESGVHVTPIARGPDDDPWLDVQINLGAYKTIPRQRSQSK